MKFTLNYSGENITTLMRRIGYFFLKEGVGELSFVRPLQGASYPRFHVYLEIKKEISVITFGLHLDQKMPSYKGTPAHNGEYDGKLVEKETERIKRILEQRITNNEQ